MERNGKVFGNSPVCFIMVLVVVRPGDQLLGPERRTDAPAAAREDADSHTQSECAGLLFTVPRGLGTHSQNTVLVVRVSPRRPPEPCPSAPPRVEGRGGRGTAPAPPPTRSSSPSPGLLPRPSQLRRGVALLGGGLPPPPSPPSSLTRASFRRWVLSAPAASLSLT